MMTEPPYTEQTGSITVQDEAGKSTTLAVISRFIDTSTMLTKGAREWSENKKKRYFDPANREFEMVDGNPDQFVCIDDRSRIFTKIDPLSKS